MVSEEVSSFDVETNSWESVEDVSHFEYGLNIPITDLNSLEKHFLFPNKEDIFNFFYVDFPMQIFGYSLPSEPNSFNYLNEIYEKLRDDNEVLVVSDEIQKSKPATLFFLSKYGCLVEDIKFFSNITQPKLWENIDVLVTSNPNLIENNPQNKTIVKYNTTYNTNTKGDYSIDSLSEFMDIYNKLIKHK